MIEEPSPAQSSPGEASTASDEVSTNEPLADEFVDRFRAKLEKAHEHPFLKARNLTPLLVDHFELGFFPPSAKGMMRRRRS